MGLFCKHIADFIKPKVGKYHSVEETFLKH